jgi:hypothetical protein
LLNLQALDSCKKERRSLGQGSALKVGEDPILGPISENRAEICKILVDRGDDDLHPSKITPYLKLEVTRNPICMHFARKWANRGK